MERWHALFLKSSVKKYVKGQSSFERPCTCLNLIMLLEIVLLYFMNNIRIILQNTV